MRKPFARLCAVATLMLATGAIAATPAMAEFGFKDLDVTFTNQDGTPVTQAGSHPYAVTTSLDLNRKIDPKVGETIDDATKDLIGFQIPGLVGEPSVTPRCATRDFLTRNVALEGLGGYPGPECSDSSAVGMTVIRLSQDGVFGEFEFPVFNLEAPPGVAMKVGFWVIGVPITLELGVNSSPPYNVIASLRNISQVVLLSGSDFTLWGDPADPSHDTQRGSCLLVGGSCPADIPRKPFVTVPRACNGPLTTSYEADSWQHPGVWAHASSTTHDAATPPNSQGFGGCGKLGFAPSIAAQPTTKAAESPTGLDFGLSVADEGLTNPTGIANSDIRKTVVTLPEGFSTNPSLAEGLEVCSEADLARETAKSAPGAGCPNASKIGTVEVETPILDENVNGSLFIAKPYENPFNSLLALYIVIKNPTLGIVVKQPLEVVPDPVTGQLTTIADDMPQLPFSHFTLHFREGTRSPLASPPACGSYEAKAELTPWSGGPPVTTTSAFQIITGPNAGPCPSGGLPPFRPGLDRRNPQQRRRALLAPSTCACSEPTANRSSPASRSSCRRGSSASSPASPTAQMRRSPRPRQGPAPSAATKSWPTQAAQPHRRSATPWSEQASAPPWPTPPARSTSPAPTTAPPLDGGDHRRRRSAPSTSAPSWSARPSRSTPRPPKSSSTPPAQTRSPTSSRASRSTPATSAPTSTDRTSSSTRPTATRTSTASTLLGSGLDFGSEADDRPVTVSTPFQAADCAALALQAEAGPEAEGRHQARRPPGLHSRP